MNAARTESARVTGNPELIRARPRILPADRRTDYCVKQRFVVYCPVPHRVSVGVVGHAV